MRKMQWVKFNIHRSATEGAHGGLAFLAKLWENEKRNPAAWTAGGVSAAGHASGGLSEHSLTPIL